MTDTSYSNFRWYIFFTMIIVTAITSMGLIAPASVMPLLFKAMPGLEPGQVTFVTMGVFNFFLAIAAIFGGILLDKLGPIKVFIGGLVLIMIGAFLMPIIGSSYWGMLFIRLLQGFGTGPIMAAAVPIAASYFPVKERGLATGAQGFAVSFGIIMGLQVVPRLAASSDCFGALRVLTWVGIIGLVLSVIAALGPKVVQEPGKADKASQDAAASNLFKKAVANPLTWVAILCFTFMSGIFQQLNSIVPGYIGADAPLGLGRGTLVGANALTLATIFFCIGSFLSGPISEKLFGGKARPIIAIGFLLGGIFAFCTKYDFVAADQSLLTIFLIITAFFYSLVNPQAMAYLAKNYPREIAGKLGGLSMFVGIMIGSTVAVWWLGKSLDATKNYMQPITIMAGLCFAGFIVSLFLKQKSAED
jgi:MFS family permease